MSKRVRMRVSGEPRAEAPRYLVVLAVLSLTVGMLAFAAPAGAEDAAYSPEPAPEPRVEVCIDDVVLTVEQGYCSGVAATIGGTEGDDSIVGTPLWDVIVGLGGNDSIEALAAPT